MLLMLGETPADSQMPASSNFVRPVCPIDTQNHICFNYIVILTMYAKRTAYYLKYSMEKHFIRVRTGSESWEQSQAARWVPSSYSVPPE